MTKTEMTQILAILKAAYPNSYKNMTTDDVRATVNVWAAQFANIPATVVMIAVNKLISTNVFPPTITEVKEKMRSLYWEAWEMLDLHKKGLSVLDKSTLAVMEQIINTVEPMRASGKIEPSLEDLLSGYSLTAITGQKQIQGSE